METYYTPKLPDLVPGFKYEVRMWAASAEGIEYRWEKFEVGMAGDFVRFGSLDNYDQWSPENIRAKTILQ